MNYKLNYGSDSIVFEIPEKNVLSNIEVKDASVSKKNEELLQQALENPVDSLPLKQLVEGKHLVLLVEDATRDVVFGQIFSALAPHLTRAKFVTTVICTGTHNPELAGNSDIINALDQAFSSVNFIRFEVVVHDSRRDTFEDCGVSTVGNRILVNQAARKADLFLALSDMKNHYFAGYSNAVKNFLPGFCALQTTERNHALALKEKSTFGFHPWHPDASRHSNPVAEDMVEGFHLITRGRPAYVLATIEKAHQVLWTQFGDLIPVTQNGMQQVDELMSQTVEPADLLIVSSGGYPNDETIYTAQRALELSKAAVKPGGKILFLAECRNGIGPESAKENFFDLLAKPLPEVFALLEKKYIMYSHKAYKFGRLIERSGFLGIHTKLPRESVEKIHLSYVDNPVAFVKKELETNPQLTINLVNDGNKIALHSRNGGTL